MKASPNPLDYAVAAQGRRHSRLLPAAVVVVAGQFGLLVCGSLPRVGGMIGMMNQAFDQWAQWSDTGAEVDLMAASVGMSLTVAALLSRNRKRRLAVAILPFAILNGFVYFTLYLTRFHMPT